MIKSVLAAVLAVGLIVGALYLRSNVIDAGEGEDPRPQASGDPVSPDEVDDARTACDASLGASCPAGSDRLDVGGLLSAFGSTPVAYDVLVAPSVIVELIEQSQTSRAAFSEDRDPVAVSPVVLATAIALDEQVADACGDAVTWTCAARLTADGTLRPAMRNVASDSTGVISAAALTGGVLENASFTANALGGGTYLDWLGALDDQVSTASQPISTVIQFNAAQANGGIELEATGLRTVTSSQRQVVNLSYPTPIALVGVVAVSIDGADPDLAAEIGDAVGDALIVAGWRSPDGTPPPDGGAVTPPPVDPASGDDGLPNGGTLFSLREDLR